jgi:hypothetical protein
VTDELTSSRAWLDDDLDGIIDFFHQSGWTDGLPIIPPTEPRVRRMLTGTDRSPQELLGLIPPRDGEATIEKIAVNAVMAGCKPEFMPVLLAGLQVILNPSWGLAPLQPTTNPMTPMLIVNGPIRNRIGLNSGTGVMGPGWQANATIGRALRLILLNIGGAIPPEIDKCTQGFAGKYTLCIGENEEESPWPPYHATQGFAPDQSCVTVVAVNSSTNVHDSSDRPDDLLKTLAGSLASPGTDNVVDPFSTPVIALNPLHARILSDAGYSREKLQAFIYKNCRLSADALSGRRSHLRRAHGDEYYLVDGYIPFTNDPRQILVVVTGGLGGGHSCYLPNGHVGHARTVEIVG